MKSATDLLAIGRKMATALGCALLLSSLFVAPSAQAQPPLVPEPPRPKPTMTQAELIKNLDAQAARFAEQWEGNYREDPASGGQRTAVVRRIKAPQFASQAVFIEVVDHAQADKIIFQRIFAFNDDPARTRNWATVYRFWDYEPHTRYDRYVDRLKPSDMLSFPKGPGACESSLFRENGNFTLSAHKDQCRIATDKYPGGGYFPEFKITVGDGWYRFFEEGFIADGSHTFGPLDYRLVKTGGPLD